MPLINQQEYGRDGIHIKKIKGIRTRTVLRLFKQNLSVWKRELNRLQPIPKSSLFYLSDYPGSFLREYLLVLKPFVSVKSL